MRRLNKDRRQITGTWTSREAAWPQAETCAAAPYEKSAQVVLRQMGLVLAGAFGFALAVSRALVALHIG
jgi:hypothetical protein